MGAFHALHYLAVGSGSNSVRAFLNHLIPFLIQHQVYSCTFNDDTSDHGVCTRENICAGDGRIATWEVDYGNERSLDNWQQQLDLMCEPDWKGGFMGSAFYFFWCLSLMVVPRQADKIGRRWLFLGSRIAECFLFVASLFVRDYWVMVAILVGFGICAAGRINVGTVFLTEWLPRKNQTAVHVVHHSGQAIVYVSYTAFFWLISN